MNAAVHVKSREDFVPKSALHVVISTNDREPPHPMTRDTFTTLFPDLAAVFRYTENNHPLWIAVEEVTEEDARTGRTLLTDLEQAAAWYRSLDNHELLQQWLENAQTRSELMSALTKLYVAYLYRHHGAQMAAEGSGYDIELEVADQLLALGVVEFNDFRPVTEQFAPEITDDVEQTLERHLQQQKETPQQWVNDILNHMEQRAQRLTEHPDVHHHILGVVTPHTHVVQEYLLSHHLAPHVDSIQRKYPHISGVVLIDPTPMNERVVFLPFHTAHRYLEQWLHRI